MTYKFKTSRQTEEILDRIDASEGLSWPTLAHLSLSLSIRKGPLMEIELFTDSQGKELGRSTVTGEMDALYKCLIELQEGRFLPEEEYFPAYVKAHLDRDDGRYVYDVEFYTSDYKEYDYEIDAATGEVLSYDYDAEYYTPPASGTSQNAISEAKAKEIALGQVPGATVSDIWEFEIDYDDGRLEYEGTIVYNHMEYEFTIDGYSGAIREWEADSVYD